MRRLALAIAALAAAPALAQPPADWTQPVTGVEVPAAPETAEELALRWEREQALVVYRATSPDDIPTLVVGPEDFAADADTPLPPPCEPPLPRSPTTPPGPPTHPPAPCRP